MPKLCTEDGNRGSAISPVLSLAPGEGGGKRGRSNKPGWIARRKKNAGNDGK